MSVEQGAPPPPQSPSHFPRSASSPPAPPPSCSRPAQTPPAPHTAQCSPDNLFKWQAIWSFFMRAPRIRSWLFQNQSPPPEQVVQSLLSGPILTGYLFGSYSERVRSYAFPDIGDLQTVFCNDGDALLGFHFGFQGVQPIMPLLFEVVKDPCLGNPNVIVRRTARQKAPIPGFNCYLAIEFNWFQSGSLAVSTSVNPVDPNDQPPTGLTACFDNAEIRVFNPAAAERFSKLAHIYGESLDLGHFPHPSNFKKLPDDFLDPPDDYYTFTICEPVDPVYRATLTPAYITPEQSFHAQDDFACVKNGMPSQPPLGGALMRCDREDVSSVAGPHTIALWKGYQQAVAHSRRTGIFSTMLGKKVGGRFGQVVSLFGRDVRYTFLSTSGINVHGRIQRLCNQLGIILSSPLPDIALMSPTTLEGSSAANSPASHFGSPRIDVDSELDLTHSVFGRMESSNRKVAHLQMHRDPQRYVAAKDSEVDKSLQRRETLISLESYPSVSFQSTEGSVPPSISQSTNTDLRATSCSEHDSLDWTRARNPKRRRYSPVSSTRTLDQRRERPQEATDYARAAGKQEATRNHGLMYPAKSETRTMPRTQSHTVAVVQDMEQKSLANRAPVRRRSFEITDMLSDDSKVYPLQHSNPSSEAFSSTPESSHTKGHPSSASALQVQKPGIPQGLVGPVADRNALPAKQELKPGAPAKKGAGTVWTCDRCGVQIRGKKGNLNRHIANKHDNIRAYACKVPNCGRKFQTRLNLVRHETAVHLGRPYTCPSCPRAFKYENDLKGHIKSAHESADATLACDICGSCFGRRSTLNRHKAKVHKLCEEQASVT